MISTQTFGLTERGEIARLFRIARTDGSYIEISDYGATLVSVVVPDRNGRLHDVNLGFPTYRGYRADTCYIGATIGRYAGRIGKARFTLHGTLYDLEKNDGENTNHGGWSGFHRKIWKALEVPSGIRFTLESPHGEGGYPGHITVSVTYTFTDDHTLRIHFEGNTDRPTYLNLTCHAYFNLAGGGSILDHRLTLPARNTLETDSRYIPTGRILPVEGTPFDFTRPKTIGSRLHAPDRQLVWNRGYNHYYLSDSHTEKQKHHVATLYDPHSGRHMELHTTLPGVVVYTGNFLESVLPGKTGLPYSPYQGITLEAQYPPDMPHHPHFPSCLLTLCGHYDEYTEYRFRTG